MPFELFYIYASDRSYGLDWIWVSIYVIIVDWIGLGHRVGGLDWIGFRKLDPCPTLRVASVYRRGNDMCYAAQSPPWIKVRVSAGHLVTNDAFSLTHLCPSSFFLDTF